MYVPTHFEESNVDVLHQLMQAHPFSTLITLSSTGINANHIPLHLIPQAGPFGALQGHVARANPVWSDLIHEVEALVIFQGPDAYISPSWYPTKQVDGKVVPTWNYITVHAYGTLRVIDDPAWVKNQLDSLTTQQEASFEKPWAIADAPKVFTDHMINAIVGVEILMTKLVGKWKLSQNQPALNQAGVVQGLQSLNQSEATRLASAVEKVQKKIR